MFRAFLFLALCVCITMLLNYALIPPSSVRINLHNLRNGQQYDTIFIGTSHGQYGIDPAAVDQATGTSSVSLCMADAYPDAARIAGQLNRKLEVIKAGLRNPVPFPSGIRTGPILLDE